MEFLIDQTVFVARVDYFHELSDFAYTALEKKMPLQDRQYTSLKEEYVMDIPPKFSNWVCKTIDENFILHKPDSGIHGCYPKVSGMWTNRMRKGDQHFPHQHNKSFYSFVAYVKTTDNDAPFYFIKDNQGIPVHIDANSMENILIFPSTLIHTVYPKQTDGDRISVSGNVIITGH
tara:strand:+ start:3492 stop:4016 length:525 start_codon:yes stop_codon:yes gene_type:complete